MDGVIHRTKKRNARRPFPWGDVIIWGAGVLALVVLFRLGGIVSDFLYGIAGIYIFTVFVMLAILGICIRTGKRPRLDKQYLCGAIMMIIAFFIAMHVGFTQSIVDGGKHAALGNYLNYCFEQITPGGVLFALPSYLLLIISGPVGTYLLLSVFFMVGLILIINRAIVKHRETKILTLETLTTTELPADFDARAKVLYEKIEQDNKKLQRESQLRFDKNKSILGLGALPKDNLTHVTPDAPVPLSQLQTPEGINQTSVAAADGVLNGLKMYNDGKVIPWQGVDSMAWSVVNPQPVTLMNQMPTMNAMPNNLGMVNTMPTMGAMPNYTQPAPQPMMPQPMAPTDSWEQPQNLQWQGANSTWSPPQNPNVAPPQINATLNRRKNPAVLQHISNQTSFQMEEPASKTATDTFKNKKYVKPTLDLIHTQSMDLSQFNAEAGEKEAKLNELFQQYNIRARVSNFSVAPAVTRFEVIPEIGTRVAQIVNMREDINYILGTSNTRIESPIEGKNAIGIEVPNHMIGTVSIKDLLGSREFLMHRSPLAICVGKNINDESVIADLAEMPHLLVAGTTGSGKSVCINTILTSLVYKTGPEDLKLLLIDMKGGTELGAYNGMPHMLVERCITNGAQAINAFKWLIREMNHRYELLQGQRVNNIALYQALPDYKSGQIEAMPYIVMVIDEVADLMSYNKKEVEDCIQNLAQKSRAAGIHLVLATQRPSVNVISGVIKANIGTRIAFRVINGMDSRTILDSIGAETLMGRGDMLFMTAKGIERVQGCYLENDELHRVMSFVRERNEAEFNLAVEDIILNGLPEKGGFDPDGGGDVGGQDPKFVEVLRYAVRENNVRQTLSISEIQRKFSVGFGRAGRIMDQLEHAGYVGADFGGGKAREVLISRDQVAELYGL